MLVVAFDAYTKHVINGLAETVEGGSGERTAIVQVVVYPKAVNVFVTDPPCTLYGVNEPNILPKSVNISHFYLFSAKIWKKTIGVSCFETVSVVNLQHERNNIAYQKNRRLGNPIQ